MIAEANKNIKYYESQLKKSPDKCCRFCGQIFLAGDIVEKSERENIRCITDVEVLE